MSGDSNMRTGDGGLTNLPLGVSVALGEITMMVVVSALVKLVSDDIATTTILLFRYALCLPLLLRSLLAPSLDDLIDYGDQEGSHLGDGSEVLPHIAEAVLDRRNG